MAKIALSILIATLLNAQQNIEVGKVYHHYKDANHLYEVVELAINSQNEIESEIIVIYKALYLKDNVLWSRSANNWLEILEIDGKKVKRFSKVEEEKG